MTSSLLTVIVILISGILLHVKVLVFFGICGLISLIAVAAIVLKYDGIEVLLESFKN